MTKADIIEGISVKTGITKSDIMVVVTNFIAAIIGGLKQNEHIELRGFGSFDVKKRARRVARKQSFSVMRHVGRFGVEETVVVGVSHSGIGVLLRCAS